MSEERGRSLSSAAVGRRLAELLVLAVWLAMLVSDHRFVARHASRVPVADDVAIVPLLTGEQDLTPAWLWSLYNEHRVPFAKATLWTLARLSSDLRVGMFVQIYALGLLALASILVARRLRGRTSVTDAFFPLLWLHHGHCENLLMAFQISLLPSTILLCAVSWIAASSTRPGPLVASLVALMPLCGAPGTAQVPALAAWLVLAAAGARAHASRRSRAATLVLTAAALALCAWNLADLRHAEGPPRPELPEALRGIWRFFSTALDPVRHEHLAAASAVALGIAAATLARLATVARRQPPETPRALGLAACLGATITVGLSVGLARGDAGLAPRYVALSAPLISTAYLAWCVYGRGVLGALVRASLLVVAGSIAPIQARVAEGYAERRTERIENLLQSTARGDSPRRTAVAFADRFRQGDVEEFAESLSRLRRAGLPPYEPPGTGERELGPVWPFERFAIQPTEVRTPFPIVQRKLLGDTVLLVHADSEIVLTVPSRRRKLSGAFGINPGAYESEGECRFAAELVSPDGARAVLFERSLDPKSRTQDRGMQRFELELPPDAAGSIVLRTQAVGGNAPLRNGAFWTRIGNR